MSIKKNDRPRYINKNDCIVSFDHMGAIMNLPKTKWIIYIKREDSPNACSGEYAIMSFL
jgi:hypothetical protein